MSVHQPVLEVEQPSIRNGAVSCAPLIRTRENEEYEGRCSLQSSVVSAIRPCSGFNGPQIEEKRMQNFDDLSLSSCQSESDSHSGSKVGIGGVHSQLSENCEAPVISLCGRCSKISLSKLENLLPNQIAAQSRNKHFRHQLLSTTQCLPQENHSEFSNNATYLSAENVSSSCSSHALSAQNQNHWSSYVSSSDETRAPMMNGASEHFVINGHPSPNGSPVCSRKASQCKCDWIDLNVGGRIFKTTRLTLSKVPGSFLDCLCNNENLLSSHMDASGAILIDREPEYWGPVLNWLRCGKLIVNDNVALEGVLEEASFCGLTALVTLLKERIRIRDTNIGGCSHVYRVLQCKEKELTQTVSTLTDGWKFEQLVNTGTCYSYGDEDQSEFLCVVSKKKADQKGDDFLDQQAQNWQNRQSNLGRGAIANRI